MDKAEGAFLTIGELSHELGVAQHILRYWETRFSQLRPLQRSGNRRYYRPADVAVARRIHALLNVHGFTVRGAQRALAEHPASDKRDGEAAKPVPAPTPPAPTPPDAGGQASVQAAGSRIGVDDVIARLRSLRAMLAEAIQEA